MITVKLLEDIRAHAAREYPRECCGLVVSIKGKQKYFPCRNIAESAMDFHIDPEDYAKAEDAGKIVKVVHSHPNVSPKPTQADLIGCERSGIPWLIMNWPTGEIYEFEPSGYEAPLEGRPYVYGVTDCFTIVRDYYKKVLNIEIPDISYSYRWWEKGHNLYLENFASSGFVEVQDIREHDSVLMKFRSKVPNHAGIIMANGCILHHPDGRLSSKEVYGGFLRKATVKILRHKDLL